VLVATAHVETPHNQAKFENPKPRLAADALRVASSRPPPAALAKTMFTQGVNLRAVITGSRQSLGVPLQWNKTGDEGLAISQPTTGSGDLAAILSYLLIDTSQLTDTLLRKAYSNTIHPITPADQRNYNRRQYRWT
jgi:hypothetical protein